MPESWRDLEQSSLTMRITISIALLLTLGGIVLSIAAFAYGREAARSAYDRLLLGSANHIASALTIRDGQPVLELPVSAFELLALAPDDRIGYRIMNADGTTLTGYDEIEVSADRGDGFFDGTFFGAPARYVIVSRRFAERTFKGTLQVVIGHTLQARQALAYDITSKALYVLAASGLAMVLLSVLVVRSVLRPLRRMADGLQARDPHDLTPLQMTVPSETAVMIKALNGFMARLDRQMNSMRHLISDTAHQLRTPVAALKAQAELLADETDPAQRERIAKRIKDRSAGLGRLLEQLLSQALVIHRGDSAKREHLDLRDIALDVFEEGDHRLLYPDMEISLNLADTAIPVRADEASIREAMKNLLGNAVKYGSAPVEIGTSIEGGLASVWVRDAGPGPDPDTLNSLGERFSVKSPTRQTGSGLGLAIAHSVAIAFDGELRLQALDEGGFQASLVFPQAQGELSS